MKNYFLLLLIFTSTMSFTSLRSMENDLLAGEETSHQLTPPLLVSLPEELLIESCIKAPFKIIFADNDYENPESWRQFYKTIIALKCTCTKFNALTNDFLSPEKADGTFFNIIPFSIIGLCFKNLFNKGNLNELDKAFLALAYNANPNAIDISKVHKDALTAEDFDIAAFALSKSSNEDDLLGAATMHNQTPLNYHLAHMQLSLRLLPESPLNLKELYEQLLAKRNQSKNSLIAEFFFQRRQNLSNSEIVDFILQKRFLNFADMTLLKLSVSETEPFIIEERYAKLITEDCAQIAIFILAERKQTPAIKTILATVKLTDSSLISLVVVVTQDLQNSSGALALAEYIQNEIQKKTVITSFVIPLCVVASDETSLRKISYILKLMPDETSFFDFLMNLINGKGEDVKTFLTDRPSRSSELAFVIAWYVSKNNTIGTVSLFRELRVNDQELQESVSKFFSLTFLPHIVEKFIKDTQQ